MPPDIPLILWEIYSRGRQKMFILGGYYLLTINPSIRGGGMQILWNSPLNHSNKQIEIKILSTWNNCWDQYILLYWTPRPNFLCKDWPIVVTPDGIAARVFASSFFRANFFKAEIMVQRYVFLVTSVRYGNYFAFRNHTQYKLNLQYYKVSTTFLGSSTMIATSYPGSSQKWRRSTGWSRDSKINPASVIGLHIWK